MYVTAVVYNLNGEQWKCIIVIGNGSSYHYNGVEYYNVPLLKNNTYYSFVRAYSFNHTESVSLMFYITITT